MSETERLTEIDRRSFINKALIAAGLGATAAIAGSAYSVIDNPGGVTIGAPGVGLEEPEKVPAEPVDVDEISRHPAEMPDSANYTLYDQGAYQRPVQRSGAITQEVHFYVREVVAEVVKGTTMTYWTFDGKVPGPMIRCRVNDTIDFYLHNLEGNSLPHNVDFHAITGPGGGAVRLDTKVGSVSNLRAKMLRPGIYVYHCAFPDIPTHISHGMYGLIVVEAATELPRVDHEFYVMQSEFYTPWGGRLAASQLADYGHLSFSSEYGTLEQPTFVVFNGRPDALTGDHAIGMHNGPALQTGETVRLFVGNIGPNLISSFHVIGEIFDTVYVEGSFDLVNHNVQTTLVPAGGAAGVEFTLEVPGDYLMVDHSIFRTRKGAAGVIHVEGQANPAVYQPVSYTSELRAGAAPSH
jgi:nitrite reductase (NO-forming)